MAEDDEDEEPAPAPLTVQAVFDLLRSPRRRHTIRVLADQPPDDPVSLVDLAEAVAQCETGHDEIDDLTHKSAYVSLYQTHLPDLEECGVVRTDYDESDDTSILPQERVHTLADILTAIDTPRRRLTGRHRYYPYCFDSPSRWALFVT